MAHRSRTRVTRFHEDFQYQAQSWEGPRGVIAKIDGIRALISRVGFIVTNLSMMTAIWTPTQRKGIEDLSAR